MNSVILAVLSGALAIIIGTLAAVGMTKTTCRFNKVISYLSTLPLMIPEIILGMVFLALFSLMGLPFGMVTLVIAHTVFCIPYIFIMVSSRLIGMDPEFEEAARDLGASQMRTFFDIILPSIIPAILSGALLAFALSIDDVIISYFVYGQTKTYPLKVMESVKSGVAPDVNALSTLILVGTILFVLLTQGDLFKKKTRQ